MTSDDPPPVVSEVFDPTSPVFQRRTKIERVRRCVVCLTLTVVGRDGIALCRSCEEALFKTEEE